MTKKKVYQQPTAGVVDAIAKYDLAQVPVDPGATTSGNYGKPSSGVDHSDDYEDSRDNGNHFSVWDD